MSRQKSYSQERLEAAVTTMLDAVNRAKREAGREDMSDLGKSRAVMHDLQWGMANAFSDIESCIRQAEADLLDQISKKA